jgi:uncharacterized protein (TIRG00374 family)
MTLIRNWRYLFGAAILIGFAALIVRSVDLASIRDALINADYRLLPLVALIYIGALFARAARWYVLLGRRLSLRKAFHISNIGYMLNALLPLRAGEVARVLLATRETPPVPMMTTLSTILLERLFDLLCVFGMFGVALLALPVEDSIEFGGMTLALGSVAGFVVLFVFAHRRDWAVAVVRFVLRIAPFLHRLHLEDRLHRFLDGLAVLTAWRTFALMLIWSVTAWALSVGTGYVLLHAFFATSDLAVVLLFTAMSSLVTTAAATVSYTPAGVGTYHAGVVLALTITGFTQPEGAPVAFAIVLHALSVATYAVFGLIGLFAEKITFDELVGRVRAFVKTPLPSDAR